MLRIFSIEFGFFVTATRKPPPPAPARDTPWHSGSSASMSLVTCVTAIFVQGKRVRVKGLGFAVCGLILVQGNRVKCDPVPLHKI